MFTIPVMGMEGVGDLVDLEKDNTVKAIPGKRFDSVLKEAAREADRIIKDTQTMDTKSALGRIDNLCTALVRAEETAAAVEFATQITTKAVNTYSQIMDIQV